jgi:hypothetical protein
MDADRVASPEFSLEIEENVLRAEQPGDLEHHIMGELFLSAMSANLPGSTETSWV